jgi:transcriptional regulator with XRE-family HTH domain
VPTDAEAIGANLRALRQAAGLTQEQLAHASGVHMTEVSRIEAGKRDPRISTLLRLARALGAPPSGLLRGLT